jgi:hypothetical protein
MPDVRPAEEPGRRMLDGMLDVDLRDRFLMPPLAPEPVAAGDDHEDLEDPDDFNGAGPAVAPPPPTSRRRGRGVPRMSGGTGGRLDARLGRRFLDRSLRRLR